jgi:hypothetical protein
MDGLALLSVMMTVYPVSSLRPARLFQKEFNTSRVSSGSPCRKAENMADV